MICSSDFHGIYLCIKCVLVVIPRNLIQIPFALFRVANTRIVIHEKLYNQSLSDPCATIRYIICPGWTEINIWKNLLLSFKRNKTLAKLSPNCKMNILYANDFVGSICSMLSTLFGLQVPSHYLGGHCLCQVTWIMRDHLHIRQWCH